MNTPMTPEQQIENILSPILDEVLKCDSSLLTDVRATLEKQHDGARKLKICAYAKFSIIEAGTLADLPAAVKAFDANKAERERLLSSIAVAQKALEKLSAQ